MTNTQELWKPIERFEELYHVSNLGNVKSLNYKRMGISKNMQPRKLGKEYKTDNYYVCVTLAEEGSKVYYEALKKIS